MNKRIHKLCKADLASNQILYLVVGDKALLLYRLEGRYQAIAATCTHQKVELDEDCFANDMLICPLHGARFDLRTGACLRGPATVALQKYRVVESSETLLIELERVENPIEQ